MIFSSRRNPNPVRAFVFMGIAVLFWKAALDPIQAVIENKKIKIPEVVIKARGRINPPSGFRWDESGYEFHRDGLEVTTIHCGPTPSWDFCLDHSGYNIASLGEIDLEYYIEPGDGDGRAVIVSISRQNSVLRSSSDQLDWWRSFSKHYNSRRGKFVAERMDLSYWVSHAVFGGVWALCAVGSLLTIVHYIFRNMVAKK